MPLTDIFMALVGIVMGALIVRHRSAYAHWAAGLAPALLRRELPLKAFFLVIGLGMNAGSLAVLFRHQM